MTEISQSEIQKVVDTFLNPHYMRHNARRLEHLASLRIPVAGMTVLEVGAGIGDHSHYYMDRNCQMTITEVKPVNLHILKNRYGNHDVRHLDMERPILVSSSAFDVVHCYGLLYHLSNPEKALEFLSKYCSKMLFLETCVSFGKEKKINPVIEDHSIASQSFTGNGCRPTRRLVFEKLKELFEYVYIPRTQPNHEEFPLDWTAPDEHRAGLIRAVFIASRETIDNEALSSTLIDQQTRHD